MYGFFDLDKQPQKTTKAEIYNDIYNGCVVCARILINMGHKNP